MQRIIFYLGIILLVLPMVSCEDFLQKDPPSSPSEAIYWKSKADYDQALTACYSVMYDNWGVLSEIMGCYDNLTDNTLCKFDEDTYGRTKTMILGDIYPTTGGFVNNVYNTGFKAVSRCNLFLKKLNEYQGGDITQNERVYMEAQAKALRGLYYHWLFLCYKEVPVFTDFLTMENQYQPKATRQELYDQIMKDFSEAAAVLSDDTYMKTPGRITKSACLAFMAKVSMFQGFSDKDGIPVGIVNQDYMKKVVEYSEQIKGYTLDQDIRTAFVETKQPNSTEMIFSVRYGLPNNPNNVSLYFGAWNNAMIQRNLVDAFECTDGQPWGESPLTVSVDEDLIVSGTADKDLIIKEKEKLFKNRDQRLVKGVIPATAYRFPENPGYPDNMFIYGGNASFTGFNALRLVQPFTPNDGTPTQLKSGPDVNLMRYAHVLLMLAEAENELNGPTQKAYDAINLVRVRAGQPKLPVHLSQEQFRTKVRKEWRYETFLEGWRYFHLKQWNELKNVPATIAKERAYTVAAKYEDRFMFWPIPQGQIDKSNGVIVQDPAYK